MEYLNLDAIFKTSFYEMYLAFINAPLYHLIFEALLALWIVKLLFIRSYKIKAKHDGLHLTEKEKEELIREWEPEPLVPKDSNETSIKSECSLIENFQGNFINLKIPIYGESMSKYNQLETNQAVNLSPQIKYRSVTLLDLGTYNFLNLADGYDLSETNTKLQNQIEQTNSRIQDVNKDPNQCDIIAKSLKALKQYGVGSCGPRGFYGTIDVHLKLESELAEFLAPPVPSSDFGSKVFYNSNNKVNGIASALLNNSEDDVKNNGTGVRSKKLLQYNARSGYEGCIYSYGLATASSIIPAFAKRGDVVFADEACHFGIQKGLQASRSSIKLFRHNDIRHLKKLIDAQMVAEAKDPAKAKVTKKFIVVEGLYQNTGQICPLAEIVPLRQKYKIRIFVEESLSFGTLGKSGRGVTDYYGLDIDTVDLIIGSMENSLGSIGGFCVGKKYIIENNYLSGLAYCFSASLPPVQAEAARAALKIIIEHPEYFRQLRYNSNAFYDAMTAKIETFKDILKSKGIEFSLSGSRDSPLFYIRCRSTIKSQNIADLQSMERQLENKFETISLNLKQIHLNINHNQKFQDNVTPTQIFNGILVTVPKYLRNEEMTLADDHHLSHSFTNFSSHSHHSHSHSHKTAIQNSLANSQAPSVFPIISPALKICIKRKLTPDLIKFAVDCIWDEIEDVFMGNSS